MSFILTKFFERKEFRDDFVNGKLYISSLSEFSDIKPINQDSTIFNNQSFYKTRNLDQRDPGEGIVADIPITQENIKEFFPNINHKNFIYSVRARSLGYSYCNIISFHKIVLYTQFLENNKKLINWNETNMNNFGKFAVVIVKPGIFLKKLRVTLDKINWNYIYGSVKYHNATEQEMQNHHITFLSENAFPINNIEKLLKTKMIFEYDAFDKFSRYNNQREWRILINRNEINKSHIKYLEIGDLSDCVKKVDSHNLGNFVDKALSNKKLFPVTNDCYEGNITRQQMRESILNLGQNQVQLLLSLISNKTS